MHAITAATTAALECQHTSPTYQTMHCPDMTGCLIHAQDSLPLKSAGQAAGASVPHHCHTGASPLPWLRS